MQAPVAPNYPLFLAVAGMNMNAWLAAHGVPEPDAEAFPPTAPGSPDASETETVAEPCLEPGSEVEAPATK